METSEPREVKPQAKFCVVFILFFGLFLSKDPPARQSFRTNTFLKWETFEGLERKWELYYNVVSNTIEDVARYQSILSASSVS